MYPRLAAKRHFCGLASLPSHTTALLQCQAAADKKSICDGVKINTFATWSTFQARKTPKPTPKNFIPSEVSGWNLKLPILCSEMNHCNNSGWTHLEFLGFLDFSWFLGTSTGPHQSTSQNSSKLKALLTVYGWTADRKFTDLPHTNACVRQDINLKRDVVRRCSCAYI